jgi:lipid-binding SYLF domain-containing protein
VRPVRTKPARERRLARVGKLTDVDPVPGIMPDMTRTKLALLLFAWVSLGGPLAAQVKETRRLADCHDLLRELVGMQEGIPSDLLQKAECVAILPSVKKAALGIGARFGKGTLVCRTDDFKGQWGAPLMISIGGGSFGFQIGGQAVDLLLLIMNPRGLDSLLKSKLTLGADASVAAGPVGRNAEAATDLRLRAEILSYSRSRGLFAGVSIEGAVLKQDKDANWALYGERVEPRRLLTRSGQHIPTAALKLVDALREMAP